MDRRTVSAPTEKLLRVHDTAMASPAIFEKTHFSAKSARQITQPPEIQVKSHHSDISGCYYGKGVEGNPRDPWNFSLQDKALLKFVKDQTPYRERHPNPECRRDDFLLT